jgi:hypothetical protein
MRNLKVILNSSLFGDKILLPVRVLEEQGDFGGSDSVLTAKLATLDNFVYAGIRQFTAEEGTVEISAWVALHLNVLDGSLVSIELISNLKKGIFAQLEPLDQKFHGLLNHRFILESFIRKNLTTLTLSSVIEVQTENPPSVWPLKIAKLIAEGSEDEVNGVLVIDTDLSVDIKKSGNSNQSSELQNIDVIHNIRFQSDYLLPEQAKSMNFRIKYDSAKITPKYIKIIVSGKDDFDVFLNEMYENSDIENCILCDIDFNDSGEKMMIYQTTERTNDSDRFLYATIAFDDDISSRAFSIQIIPLDEIEDAKNDLSVAEQQSLPDMMQCTNCFSFVTKEKYDMHSAFCLRNNVFCKSCNSVYSKDSFKDHWHCDKCSKWGKSQASKALSKHEHYMHKPLICKCGISQYLPEMLDHRRDGSCPKRLIICRYCHVHVEAGDVSTSTRDLILNGPQLSQHESECGSRTVKCIKCSKTVMIKDVKGHMAMHELDLKYRPLPFQLCANQICSNSRTSDGDTGSLISQMKLCKICFSPFWNPSFDENNVKLKQKLVSKYYFQLYEGCGKTICHNKVSI